MKDAAYDCGARGQKGGGSLYVPGKSKEYGGLLWGEKEGSPTRQSARKGERESKGLGDDLKKKEAQGMRCCPEKGKGGPEFALSSIIGGREWRREVTEEDFSIKKRNKDHNQR